MFHFIFPILIVKAEGEEYVTGVTIGGSGIHFQFILEPESMSGMVLICLAVDFPSHTKKKMAGHEMEEQPVRGRTGSDFIVMA